MDGPKDTNPKDAVAVAKASVTPISHAVMAEVGVAMMEGAQKYGRHNWRGSKVRTSIYIDAAMRHLMAYWEGETIDPASGMPHITKAIAGLTVLRDAQIVGTEIDDRPPPVPEGWWDRLEVIAREIIETYPEGVAPVTRNQEVD